MRGAWPSTPSILLRLPFLESLGTLGFDEVVMHRLASCLRTPLTHCTINIVVLLRGLFQVQRSMNGFAAIVEQDRRYHVHERGEDPVLTGGGDRLMKLHVVHQVLCRVAQRGVHAGDLL